MSYLVKHEGKFFITDRFSGLYDEIYYEGKKEQLQIKLDKLQPKPKPGRKPKKK